MRESALPKSPIVACLVIGSNCASSLRGSSKGLSTPEDRESFLNRRNSSEIGAIVIGRRTALSEPYQRAPVPVQIFDRTSGDIQSWVGALREKYQGVLLCEGGVSLIHLLLQADLIDQLWLSRVDIAGDANFLDEELLSQRLVKNEEIRLGRTRIEGYQRAAQ